MKVTRIGLMALAFLSWNAYLDAQPVLYGIGHIAGVPGNRLMILDPDSGAFEVIGDPIGYGFCAGMDYAGPGLFAVCQDEQQGGQELIRIDPQTAQAVRVGSEPLQDILDISFRSDGRLFAWKADQGNPVGCATGRVISIDTATGTTAPLGTSGLTECGLAGGVNSLAFDNADRLYVFFIQNIAAGRAQAGAAIVDQSSGSVNALPIANYQITHSTDSHPLDGGLTTLISGGISPGIYVHLISLRGTGRLTYLPFNIGVQAIAWSPASSLIAANVVDGPAAEMEFRSQLTMINLSGSTLEPAIKLFDNQGNGSVEERASPSMLPVIAPHGTSHFSLTGPGGGFFNGWAQLSWESLAPVQAASEVALLNVPGEAQSPAGLPFPIPSQALATAVQSAVLRQAHSFTAPGIITPFRESAFAIVNPSALESATVEVQALGQDGQPFDINEIEIPPHGRVSLLLFELLNFGKVFLVPPQRPDDFAGSVHISSNLPIAVTGLTVLLPEGKWTGLPVEPEGEF